MTSARTPRAPVGQVNQIAADTALPRLAVLPQYAADHGWLAVHPAQLAGGLGWAVVGVLLASRGFDVSVSPPAMARHLPDRSVSPGQSTLLWRWTGRWPDPAD